MKWYEDPIYWLMCEKAVEIQKAWKPKDGDFYKDKDLIAISHRCPCGNEDDMGTTEGTGSEIWLPRQGQLQIISKLSWQEFDYACINDYPLASTKEQSGIRAVMFQLYLKTWNGHDWEKEGTVEKPICPHCKGEAKKWVRGTCPVCFANPNYE